MTPRALLLLLSLLFALSAAAQLPRNEIAVSAGWIDFAAIGGARAVGASYSRFLTPNIAAQLGAMRTDGRGNELNDVHADAAVYPLREHMVSPWGALGVAHIAFDDFEGSHTKTTWIAGAGVDAGDSKDLLTCISRTCRRRKVPSPPPG
jgi:opacity protein-like surface antigen